MALNHERTLDGDKEGNNFANKYIEVSFVISLCDWSIFFDSSHGQSAIESILSHK